LAAADTTAALEELLTESVSFAAKAQAALGDRLGEII